MDPDVDDGQVYDREPEADQSWQLAGVRLSVFLVHVAAFEAIFNARLGGTSAQIRPEHPSEVLAPLAPIPGPAWRWPSPGHDLYSGDGLLAMAGPNYGPGETPETAEYREVFIAGRDRSALDYLAGIDGIEWNWSSWRDEAEAARRSEPVERPNQGQ